MAREGRGSQPQQPPEHHSTFDVLILELCEEARDAVGGDGEGDAGGHLERVDANDLAVLGGEVRGAITPEPEYRVLCPPPAPRAEPVITAPGGGALRAVLKLTWKGPLGFTSLLPPNPAHPLPGSGSSWSSPQVVPTEEDTPNPGRA